MVWLWSIVIQSYKGERKGIGARVCECVCVCVCVRVCVSVCTHTQTEERGKYMFSLSLAISLTLSIYFCSNSDKNYSSRPCSVNYKLLFLFYYHKLINPYHNRMPFATRYSLALCFDLSPRIHNHKHTHTNTLPHNNPYIDKWTTQICIYLFLYS